MPLSRLPEYVAGYVKRTTPSTSVSTGPVKISPSGKFSLPSQGIQVLPATPSVRSVPSLTTRIVFRSPSQAPSSEYPAPRAVQSATGSSWSRSPAR